MYFSWINKKYFSSTVKKPLSPTYLFTSVNVCKQTTPGIPEVTCELMLFDGPSQYSSKCKCKCNLHETHDYGFIARDVPDMGYQPGGEIMASLLPVATHMQKLSY